MKKMAILLGVMMVLGFAGSALAVDVTVHGDLNNRFNLYTNQAIMYSGAESIAKAPVRNDSNSAFWGDIKYRLWTDLATNDGKVKVVYAIELGALRFGQQNYSKGGGATYSGDGVNIETRWAYTDFQLPFVQNKARVQIGLLPFMVNHWLWQETAMGVQLAGDAGPVGYKLAWVRGHENYPTDNSKDAFQDADNFLIRGDLKPMEGTKAGLFFLFQRQDAFNNGGEGNAPATSYELKNFGNDKYNIYTIGTDGSFATPTGFGNAFLNWDLMYQGGAVNNGGDNIWGQNVTSQDVSAYFAHADLGVNIGKAKLTYTTWYASGDDDPTDNNIDNFMPTDIDIFQSVVLQEGGYTDDNYFTEADVILDKGMYVNKLAADFKATDKTTLGAAYLYLRTAQDLKVANSSLELGHEFDAYVSHKLFPNVEVAVNAGYLISGDAMDNFVGGSDAGNSADDIFRSTARVRYKF